MVLEVWTRWEIKQPYDDRHKGRMVWEGLSRMSKLLTYLDRALDVTAATLIFVSMIFYVWNSMADAIYVLLLAVLINQRGRLVDWIRR